MSRRCVFCLPISFLVCALATMPAPAATQNWGDFIGDTVMYLNVTELNGEPNLLFSMPSVVGDTLEFDPVNFFSDTDPGPGVDITDSELSTVIMSKPGYFIENFMVSEAGDFSLIGLPGALAEANVGAAFFFTVLEVDGAAVANGPSGVVSMQFTTGGGPNGGEFSLPGDAGVAVPWQGTAFIDIASAMAASPFSGQNATKVRLTFDNSLSTIADANASAFIKKKVIGGLTIQTNVPEPGSVMLALVAGVPLALLAAGRRK
jgi:hypothetical protein